MDTLIIFSGTVLVLMFHVRGLLSRIIPVQDLKRAPVSTNDHASPGLRKKSEEPEKPDDSMKAGASLKSGREQKSGPPGNCVNSGRRESRHTAWHDLIGPLSMKTPEGSASLLGIGGIGTSAGIVTLFVDLPVISLFLIGLVSVVALALTAAAARVRFFPGDGNPRDSNPASVSGSVGPDTAASFIRPASAENHDRFPVTGTSGQPDPSGAEHYWVNEPFSSVTIRRNGSQGLDYTVIEPALSRRDKVILAETHAHLRDVIVYEAGPGDAKDHLDPATISDILHTFDPCISDERLSILSYYLKRDLSGYGPLEVLMQDPALEDISCNGSDLPVFVFHKAHGSIPTSIVFREGELNQYVLKLAQKANKQISLSNPLVDATLPDGARIQITYSNVVSTNGSSFTVRKFRADPMTPLDLIRFGTFSAETLAFLWLAIEHRKSLLIVGGTASGKTSTMNAVSLFIPENAKIVSLEDTREIQLPHRNWLPTRTRELNVPGIRGDIDLFSLLRACMRQRPEYIIVGEVRGPEAQTLFQAMNTGHATLSTIHAGSVYEAINRLTHDPINVPPVMFTTLDLVIVQSLHTDGNSRIRRNLSIHEIEVDKDGEVIPVPLYEWDIRTDSFRRVTSKSRVLEEIAFHRGWDAETLGHEIGKRKEFFLKAIETPNPDIHDLAHAIHATGG